MLKDAKNFILVRSIYPTRTPRNVFTNYWGLKYTYKSQVESLEYSDTNFGKFLAICTDRRYQSQRDMDVGIANKI